MSAGGSSGRSLGKLDIARREKVANTFGPGLSIRMEPIVLHKSKARNASPLRVARLFRYSSNLFPAGRVQAGSVRNHTVEVEQDRSVSVAGNCISNPA